MSGISSKRVDFSERTSRQRAFLILGVLTFIACYQWVYIHWAYPTFAYLGYDYIPPSTGYLVLAWMLSALPSLWMPLSMDRPSKLIYWVLYLTVFIPSIIISLFASINPPAEVAQLMLTLFAGFAFVGLSYRRPLLEFPPPRLPSTRFWHGFGLVAGVLAVWILVAFWGKLHIVSFSDIYDLRNSADDVIADSLLNYPSVERISYRSGRPLSGGIC